MVPKATRRRPARPGPATPAPSITSIPSTLPDQPTAPPTPQDPTNVKCEYRKDDSGAPAKFVGMPSAKPAKAALAAKNMTIKTNQGDIVIELVPESTPCTVNSFYFLAKKNYFDNTLCHRLTTAESNGLDLLQCGDPQAKGDGKNKSDGTGGPGYLFPDENLGPAYSRGVVFMAQGGDAANSNGSQFAISYSDEAAQLPAAYTPFGVVHLGPRRGRQDRQGGCRQERGRHPVRGRRLERAEAEGRDQGRRGQVARGHVGHRHEGGSTRIRPSAFLEP